MGKPTKSDSGSGGDERDERRIKSGSNPSKGSSGAVKRLNDNESSRTKSTIQLRTSARHSQSGRSGLKQPTNVTVHTPLIGTGSGQPTNRTSNVAKPTPSSSNKEVKKTSEGGVRTKSQSAKMKQETESSDHEPVDDTQESSTSAETIKQQQQTDDHKNGLNGDEGSIPKNGNANGSERNGEGASNDEEMNLHLEADDQNSNRPDNDDDDFVACQESAEESKDDDTQSDVKQSNDESVEESQTDTESGSVDVVESTTSELSEATESSEMRDAETQNKNDDDASVNQAGPSENSSEAQEANAEDVAMAQCTVNLTDVSRDPQNEEGNVAQSATPATPSRRRPISARRPIRAGGPSASPFINSPSISRSLNEPGPPHRSVSGHIQSLAFETSASTSTNGSSSTQDLKRANQERRPIESSPVEMKRRKVIIYDIDEKTRTHVEPKRFRCNIM